MPEVMAGYVRKPCRNNFFQPKDFLGKERLLICMTITTDAQLMDVDSILHHAFKLGNIPCFIEEKLVKYLLYVLAVQALTEPC